MQVAVSGSSGLVGRALVDELEADGHEVLSLVRSIDHTGPGAVLWDPANGRFEVDELEGVDAVVHLAGEPIDQRWSKTTKQRIRRSRVEGTELLVDGLLSLEDPPSTLVSGSAVGYYGDRGDVVLDETSQPGDNWVAGVCHAWEDATTPAAKAGMRVVQLRTGIVLSSQGGALAKMLLPFKLGIGGKVGRGDQWYSWISREDAVGAIRFVLQEESLDGPVNMGAPNPVRNKRFTKALGSALGRPTVLPIPGFAMRMLYGQMADELLLASARMAPAKLEQHGYSFEHPTIEKGLDAALDG